MDATTHITPAIERFRIEDGINHIEIDETTPKGQLIGGIQIQAHVDAGTLYATDHIIDDWCNTNILGVIADLSYYDEGGNLIETATIDEDEIIKCIC